MVSFHKYKICAEKRHLKLSWIKLHYAKLFIGMMVFGLSFATGSLLGNHFDNPQKHSLEQKIEKNRPVNILFMGIDARASEVNSRSDTMILASINKKTKQVALVWIPRDTRIQVSGHYAKINSVNYILGPEEACKVAGDLLDTDVKYYAVTNFTGFAKIIDILGGVDIDVEMNMYHADPNPALNINLAKGLQHLNGQDALRYVRFRGGPTADIGRTGRQQNFIKAMVKEMIKSKNIFKLPKLIPEIADNVHTNIPLKDILYMADLARDFDFTGIVTQTLPGFSFTDPQTGASYWEADREISHGIIEDLLSGETFEVATDPPGWARPVYVKQEIQNEDSEDSENSEDSEEIEANQDIDQKLEGSVESSEEAEESNRETGENVPENETESSDTGEAPVWQDGNNDAAETDNRDETTTTENSIETETSSQQEKFSE